MLRPVGKDRDLDAEDEIRQAVFARDRWCCVLWWPSWPRPARGGLLLHQPCSGRITPHHRRKAGAAGSWSMENLVTLCVGHNKLIEDEPDLMAALFPHLVIREGDPEWEELGRRAHRLR